MAKGPPHVGRFAEAKRVYLAVRDLGLAQRDDAIEAACGGDEDLKDLVLDLLEGSEAPLPFESLAEDIRAAYDRMGGTAETGDSGSDVATDDGTSIGHYRLLQRIGEGGFGVVYMAEQSEPVRRRVALKVIKLGMDTKRVIARFEAERQALAMMDHPNIAKVLDAGSTTTGRPYFVMELVKGVPITEYCDTHSLSARERLRLFLDVCSAVQHAHHKGIIHRDIKPSNVLVTLYDGRAVPKVIDFGVAKATSVRLTEHTLFTEHGQVIGTPQYMSPEQAEMSGLDVDARTDIYSLGVLLYELLTGTTPHDGERLRSVAYGEMHRIIREEEAQRPSIRVHTLASANGAAKYPSSPRSSSSIQEIASKRHTDPVGLRRALRGDLDWIVVKAIEQDRTRRYDSAGHLADDIERYLRGDAVSASPPSAHYQLFKLIRRHRGPFAAALVVFGVLLLGIMGTSGGLAWALDEAAMARAAESAARSAEVTATESEREARLAAFEALVISAGQAMRDGKDRSAAVLLDQVNPGDRNHWWDVARAMNSSRFTVVPGGRRFKWNSDSTLAGIVSNERVQILDGSTLELLRTLDAPEGTRFARLRWTQRPDRFALTHIGEGAQLYDAVTLEPLGPVVETGDIPLIAGEGLAIDRSDRDGGKWVAVTDMQTGDVIAEREVDGFVSIQAREPGRFQRWASTGPELTDGVVRLVSIPDLEREVVIDERTPRIKREPGPGEQVVTRVEGGIVECWWINEEGVPAFGWARAFEDSPLRAFGGLEKICINEGSIRHVLDTRTGRPLLKPFNALANGNAWGMLDWEGNRYLSEVSGMGSLLFDLRDYSWPYSSRVAESSCREMLLSDDGRIAVVATWDAHFLNAPDSLCLLDAKTGIALATLLPEEWLVRSMALSNDAEILAAGISTSRRLDQKRLIIRAWSLRSGRVIWERDRSEHGTNLRVDGFSPDGTLLYCGGEVIDARSGKTVGTVDSWEGSGLLTPDARAVVEFTRPGGEHTIRELGTEKIQAKLDLDFAIRNRRAMSFSPDSRLIVIPMSDGSNVVFSLETGARLGATPEGIGNALATAWSRDGTMLASGGQDRFIRIWDAESFRLLGVLAGHDEYVRAIRFSPDSESLYSVSGDGTYRIWNARTPWEQVEFVQRRQGIAAVLRPAIDRIVLESVDPEGEDAWAALGEMDMEGEQAELAELLLIGALLEGFGD